MRSRSLPVALCFADTIHATAGTKERNRGGEPKKNPLNREVAPGTILIQPTHPRTLYYTRLYAQESQTYTHTSFSHLLRFIKQKLKTGE
jgi:hypothetical protein